MKFCTRRVKLGFPRRYQRLLLGVFLSHGIVTFSGSSSTFAQTTPSIAYCHLSADSVDQTNTLRQSALTGGNSAKKRYQAQLVRNADYVRRCRNQSWLKNQAVWVRFYPCDIKAGALDELLDRLVSRGYNQVHVEVFYDSRVLLPVAANPTVWPSVIRAPGYENRDLLAELVTKGHERGLKVYAWLFTLNFGHTYAQRPEAQAVLARNGYGQTGLTAGGKSTPSEVFVDPYSVQAKQSYSTLVQAVLQRRPDGVLFDYIRYPKGTGAASVAGHVRDLWIYGNSAVQALYNRALNQQGVELIYRFLSTGQVSAADLSTVHTLYPTEEFPQWQGRTIAARATSAKQVQTELWQFTVAHAIQGLLDFLSMAVSPVQQRNIKAGAVFFPEANQAVGSQGYDSRLQPWDRFPQSIEWHPMAYGTCGNASCIVSQVQRVVSLAASGTSIVPSLAGTWGQAMNQRPALEDQMQAIHRAVPRIDSISHFALSWQDPQNDRDRKACQLP